MPRIIRQRSAPNPWWSSLLAGAVVGGLAASFMLWSRRPGARRLDPDLVALSARLHEHPGAGDLKLRSLGQGIVELVGSADADLNIHALLQSLGAEPGVSVVVNRAWIRS